MAKRPLFLRSLLFAATLIGGSFLSAPTRAESQASLITVQNIQVRAVASTMRSTTVYTAITNESDQPERLQDASSAVAENVELHKIMNNRGLKRMHEVEEIVIPPQSTLSLRVGTYHLMLVGLKRPLKVGESIPLELRFAGAGKVVVSAPVVAMGAKKKARILRPS